MYYSYINNFRGKTYHFLTISFLFAIFLLNIFCGYARAEIEFGPTAEEYRSIGYKAQQEGDFDRALTFYHKALAMMQDDVWTYNNLGVIYEQMGMVDRAEGLYLKALELDSNYLPPYTNLAFLYKERGDIPRAISYFRTRIEYAPDKDKWIPVLVQELEKIDPNYRSEVVEAQLEETGERLYQMAQEELSLDIARADGHYRQAQKFLAENHFKEASEQIQKALVLTPDNPKLKKLRKKITYNQHVFEVKERVNKALEFLDSGDMDSAGQEFQTILTILSGKSAQE
jgi:Flp pilus assembly protein TadD